MNNCLKELEAGVFFFLNVEKKEKRKYINWRDEKCIVKPQIKKVTQRNLFYLFEIPVLDWCFPRTEKQVFELFQGHTTFFSPAKHM